MNAADAFDIGSFDEDDTKGIKLTDADQELYKNFPLVISERWQLEIAETIFDFINLETDKIESKRKQKQKQRFNLDERGDFFLNLKVKISNFSINFFRIRLYFTRISKKVERSFRITMANSVHEIISESNRTAFGIDEFEARIDISRSNRRHFFGISASEKRTVYRNQS